MPLSKSLIDKIQLFFEYYWKHSPLLAFKSETDERFMSELPDVTVQSIYIEFLFRDFLYKFDNFFIIKDNENHKVKINKDDFFYRQLIVSFL